jgi:hypothetical protein
VQKSQGQYPLARAFDDRFYEQERDEHLVVGTDLDADTFVRYFRAYTSLSTLIIPTGSPALAANSVRRRRLPSAKLSVRVKPCTR